MLGELLCRRSRRGFIRVRERRLPDRFAVSITSL